MKVELIHNLQSILVKKESVPITINSDYDSTERILSVKNLNYDVQSFKLKLIPFCMQEVKLFTKNLNNYTDIPFLVKHSVLPFYSRKYEIGNPCILDNIEEFYRITKVFVIMFNDKYRGIIPLELTIKPDVIFNILKFHEKTIVGVEEYKHSKVDEVIPQKLFDSIKRL